MSMNEPYDRTRRRSRMMIIGGGVIAAIVSATVLASLIFVSTAADDAPETREVVTAARDIPGRKPIEEADLTMRTIPVDPSLDTAFTRIDEVLGRVSSITIPVGEVVTRNLLASTTTGQTFSIIAPGEEFDADGPDLRAVSVTVPDAMAVGGTVQAGQRIDLVATITFNPQLVPEGADGSAADGDGAADGDEAEGEGADADGADADGADADGADGEASAALIPGPTTRTTLQNMTVLERNGAVYILRADLNTAEKIGQLIAAGAQFMMVLRPEQDERVAVTEGSTLETLVDEFGFVAPKAPAFDGQPGFKEEDTSPSP